MGGIKKLCKYVKELSEATKRYWYKYKLGKKIDPMYTCGFSHGVEWESSRNRAHFENAVRNSNMTKHKAPALTGKYPEQIKRLRAIYGLTQEVLAEKLGVSFATVNRWEKGRTQPSKLSWNQLRQFEQSLMKKSAKKDTYRVSQLAVIGMEKRHG